MSESKYELPKRQNVIQVELPLSRTKTVDYEIDPTKQIVPDLKPKNHGMNMTKFLEVKATPGPKIAIPSKKNKEQKGHPQANRVVATLGINDALKLAQAVEKKAKKLSESIVV